MSMPDDSAKGLYKQLGIGGELVMQGRAGLILVDVQRGFFELSFPLGGDFGELPKIIARLLEKCRQRSFPIAMSRVAYNSDFSNAGVFGQKVPALRSFCEGSEARELASFVEVLDGDYIFDKQQPSAFFETGLSAWLRLREIEVLLIAGVTTSGCVRATAVDAMSLGFTPLVISNAVGDRHQVPHENSLFDLRSKYARVEALEEIFSNPNHYELKGEKE